MKSLVRIVMVLVATCLVAAPALAQQNTDLEKRIRELEAKLEALSQAQEAPKATLMNSSEVERSFEPVPLQNFFDEGYLVMTSRDGAFKYWLDGRLMVDYANYQGAQNRLPDGVEIRRGRIGVKATLWKNFLTEIDIDFADNVVSMKDMWVGYSFKNGIIRVGNHKSPFGMDTLTSSKYIMFIERAYVDSLSPDRRIGVSYSGWGTKYQFSGGLFFQEAGLFDNKDTLTGGAAGTDQKLNFVGRFSFAPINRKGRVLHLGVAAARRKPDVSKIATSGADLVDRENAAMIVKFDSRAETHVSRAKFLSTGDMKYVDHFNQLGLELAGTYGPLTFQGEWQGEWVKRIPTTVATYSDHSFGGYYAQAGYLLTGESRPYSVTEGEFGRVIPKRKWGAVEAAVRYSVLNLNDATEVDPILGGEAKNTTFGLTWFFNPNYKVMFNVTRVNNDQYAKPGKDWAPIPAGTSTTLTPIAGDDFTTIAVRFQVAF